MAAAAAAAAVAVGRGEEVVKTNGDKKVADDSMEDSESRRRPTLRSLLTPPDPISASFADLMGVDDDYYYDGDGGGQYFYDDSELKNIQEAVNGAIGQAKANGGAEDKARRATSRLSKLQQQQRRSLFNHRRLGGAGGATGLTGVGATGLTGVEYTNPADALSVSGSGLSGPSGIGNTAGGAGIGNTDAIGTRMRARRRNNGLRRVGGYGGGGSGYGGGGSAYGGTIERSSGYGGGGGHSGGGYGGHSGGGGGHPIVILKKKKSQKEEGILDDILDDLFGDSDTFLLLFGAALVAAAAAVGIAAFLNQGGRRRRSLAGDDDDDGGNWETLEDKFFAAVSKGRRGKENAHGRGGDRNFAGWRPRALRSGFDSLEEVGNDVIAI